MPRLRVCPGLGAPGVTLAVSCPSVGTGPVTKNTAKEVLNASNMLCVFVWREEKEREKRIRVEAWLLSRPIW